MGDDLHEKIRRAQVQAAEQVVVDHLAQLEAKFLAEQKAAKKKRKRRSKKP